MTTENQFEKLRFLMNLTNLEGNPKQPEKKDKFDSILNMLDSGKSQIELAELQNPTPTIAEQLKVEETVKSIYEDYLEQGSNNIPSLHAVKHLQFINASLKYKLPGAFAALDSSHPWMIYWLLNSKCLLEGVNSIDNKDQIIDKLFTFWNEDGDIGGFSGSDNEYQLPHLAATYATLLSLCILIDDSNFKGIKERLNVEKLHHWLLKMKQPDGSYIMHMNGETDVRAVYCALTIIKLLNIKDPKLTENTLDWLISCQNYEGGFGGDLFDEAHGGYAFCGLNAILLLVDTPEEVAEAIDLDLLIDWTVKRQYSLEGGLSGRTNKLVDGCYSNWIGTLSPLLECIRGTKELINRDALENYILCCCQDQKFGGLKDKPGKRPDYYHTNYVLCGLSVCQSFHELDQTLVKHYGLAFGFVGEKLNDDSVLGLLDPVFAIPGGSALRFKKHFIV